ncbi:MULTISPECIES: hypothetical protein [Nocardiaceae]|uniref:hypothetical protein n=1 Tax=Nocardiaceae TaxID=85025 RepID=UPI000AA4C85D|nr:MULTISPECIES: hypothetical protein [Rhodococcus]NIL75851.1 hypothetical protein [Rhodococcus sp. B10]
MTEVRIALGVHVSTYEVTASLVETGTPEQGPIATRTVPVAAAPGGIAGAVSTALGFMSVQARQHDVALVGAAVVCENSLQREIVADALAETEPDPVLVVDIFDERLTDAFSSDVAAALLVGEVDVVAPRPGALPGARRTAWPVAAAAACVLAALGGVTAWAMTSSPTPHHAPVPVEMVHPTNAVTMTVEPLEPVEPEAVIPGPPVPVEIGTATTISVTRDAVAPAPVVPPRPVSTQTQQPGPVASTTSRTTQAPELTTTTPPPVTTTTPPDISTTTAEPSTSGNG